MIETPSTIDAEDIDLAASYFATFDKMPPAFYPDNSGIAKFELKDNEATRELITSYITGALTLNIRRFCACRARLYKALREGRR